MKKIIPYLFWWILIPHGIAYLLSSNKVKIKEDLKRWLKVSFVKCENVLIGGVRLLLTMPEFRNLYYLRLGYLSVPLRLYLPQMSTLFIAVKSENFGEGTYIQHGFATIIVAEKVGKNCWINQQVTIGYNNSSTIGYGKPVIGDNVRISAGVKILGPITIGNNVTIGANAVVVKDVPDNCVVVPSASYILKKDGVRINEKL
jgi:serine O-acetyltransferase